MRILSTLAYALIAWVAFFMLWVFAFFVFQFAVVVEAYHYHKERNDDKPV